MNEISWKPQQIERVMFPKLYRTCSDGIRFLFIYFFIWGGGGATRGKVILLLGAFMGGILVNI